eukprot:2566096-Pyramimonas_sp.AAC.1
MDVVQTRLLQSVAIREKDALLRFPLVLLASRRGIAMPGLTHCAVFDDGSSHWEPAVNRQPWLPPGTRRAS